MAGAEPGEGSAMAADPMRYFQDWFNKEIQKREKLNQDLQIELDKYKQQNAELTAQLDAREDETENAPKAEDLLLAHEPKQGEPVSYDTYSKLREKQEITWQSLKVCNQALESYKAKYRKAKDLYRPWREYAQRCEDRLRAKQAGLSTPEPHATRPSADNSSRPSSAGAQAFINNMGLDCARSSRNTVAVDNKEHTPVRKSPSKLRAQMVADRRESSDKAEPFGEFADETIVPLPMEQHIVNKTAMRRLSPQLQRTSSLVTDETEDLPEGEETRDDAATALLTAQVEPMAPPSLRTLNHQVSHRADGSANGPIHIKSEPGSSPIALRTEESTITRVSTFDLDETGDHITTPRKLERMQSLLRANSSFSRSFPPPGGANARPLREEHTRQFGWDGDMPQPLQPLSPNRRDLPKRAYQNAKQPTTRKRKHHLSEEVVSVTEDGHGLRSKARSCSPARKMKANHTLQALLGEHTPAKRQLITPKTDPAARRSNEGSFLTTKSNGEWRQRHGIRTDADPITPKTILKMHDDDDPNRAQLKAVSKPSEFAGHHSNTTSSIHKPKLSALDVPVAKQLPPDRLATPQTTSRRSPRKRAIPLRQRPVIDLKPEDFKLNPAAHGMLDLSNLETVRTRDERRHFHSCTDPSCATCGPALRELARAMPLELGSTIWASTQDDLDNDGNPLTEDERIIKYHLGSTFSPTHVRSLPRVEYEELLWTAKTHLVAERYGRHRLRPNARAKSPPGYWDVDMPTTQDMEMQAAERERRDRELVAERYREAMRRGGKWMFKDE